MEYIFKGVFGIIYFVAMFRLSNCKLLSENGPFLNYLKSYLKQAILKNCYTNIIFDAYL